MKKTTLFFLLFAFITFGLIAPGQAKKENEKKTISDTTMSVFSDLKWRNIGPAIMGGRVTDIEGIPGNPLDVVVGFASGGVWRTKNGGVTWEPLFEKQNIYSIGDIARDPLHPNVIWVGTGEDNPRNSTSFGKGVFKTVDGGKTWEDLGLHETERIARIILHPQNPNIAYVAAVGKVFGPSPDRGVYMTVDGGKTWKKVLYIDEYHGASDVEIDPNNPNILYAGMWYFQRKPWDFDSGSTKGGVYKSIDGGQTWKKLTNGLPELMGKVAIEVSPHDSNTVYVLAESKKGALFVSHDGGEHFKVIYKKHDIISRGFYYTDLRLHPTDPHVIFSISSRLWRSDDGGKTFKRIARRIHVDFHTMWIDPKNPNEVWVGNDGGIAVSHDGTKTWEFINNIAAGQFYEIFITKDVPVYKICGGLQDNGTWCGPSRSGNFMGILNDEWFLLSYGDGFHVVEHPEKRELYLSEYQAGGISFTNMKTGEQISNSPFPERNDGGPVGDLKYRFDWNAPIVQSPHNPDVIYFGGQVVFRSKDFGKTWEVISPDLTTNDPEKLKSAGGPIFPENTTAEYHCTLTSIAESPAKPGILWTGSDDGLVHVSPDNGKTWLNVTKNIKGLPPDGEVTFIEPSHVKAERAYVTVDRHMMNDFSPYIFVTEDLGKTWKRITKGLPKDAYVHVVREDPANPDILYAGTELGPFISWNRGQQWYPIRLKNLPPVPVRDIEIHPELNDIVLGTHGRSIWIFDDATPIRQKDKIVSKPALFLFRPRTAYLKPWKNTRIFMGDEVYAGENLRDNAFFYIYTNFEEKDEKAHKKMKNSENSPQKDKKAQDKKKKVKEVKIRIYDENGKLVNTLKVKPKKDKILRVNWNLSYKGPEPRQKRKTEHEEFWFYGRNMGPRVLPGTYRIVAEFNGTKAETTLTVQLAPDLNVSKDDLEKQFNLALKLRELISDVNLELRRLDVFEKEIKNLKSSLASLEKPQREKFKNIEKKAKEIIKTIRKLKEQLTNTPEPGETFTWEKGPGLREKLQSLYFDVRGPFHAPLPQQEQFAQELQDRLKEPLKNIQNFFNKDAKDLVELVQKSGAGTLILPVKGQPMEEDET